MKVRIIKTIRDILHSCFFSYGVSALMLVIVQAIDPDAEIHYILMLRSLLIASTINSIFGTLIYTQKFHIILRRVIASSFALTLFPIATLLSGGIDVKSINILYFFGFTLLSGIIATSIAFIISDRIERAYLKLINRALEKNDKNF